MKDAKQHGTHGWWMTAACAAMVLAILALTTLGTGIGSYGYLLFLLCPILHLVMHRRICGASGSRDEEDSPRPPPTANEMDRG